MTTTRRAATVGALLLLVVVAAAWFLFLRRGPSDAGQFAGPPTTNMATTAATTTEPTSAAPGGTVTDPGEPSTTSTATTTTTGTLTDPDTSDTTTSTTATTTATGPEPDEPAPTTTTTVPTPAVRMPPEPDEWWTYTADPDFEWRHIVIDWLLTNESYLLDVLPKIDEAADVARQVKGFWDWYMTEGHPQGAALDLSDRPELEGDAVGQLMYLHHRFWQQRLPVWDEVWNREFETARFEQRNKLIYLDALGELNQRGGSVGPPTLLYNPADETSVWRYWGPIIRPVPNQTAPRRSGQLLPDDIRSDCGPEPEGSILRPVSWDCVHLGPAEDTALGEWDLSWYYDIPHEEAAWYVYTPESAGPVRYDPNVHGAPTSPNAVNGGDLVYLPATVADGAYWPDIVDALKPYRPEGFPEDPEAYREMWRYDLGGGWWHKEMGQLVLLVPVDQMVGWLEANGYDPHDMFANGWPNPDEERLIRNTWGRDWDRTNPDDHRNRLSVGWLEQGVEIGDSGNLAADIEAAIHISAWMDWAYRARIRGDRLPITNLTGWWNPSAWAPGVTIRTAQDAGDALFGHRADGWATVAGLWQGLYHQQLSDGYHPGTVTGRLTHPALNPDLPVWKEWAAAGEAEKWLGFQAADGESPLGPVPGETWIPWYPEDMVPLEDHYLLPEGAVAHWESVVDWWPEDGLEMPVHQPDWYHAYTVAGPDVWEAGGHMFETCLWATGGLFAAWSLPHPELEDASPNVTWIVRGIADRRGRIVELAEPINQPCLEQANQRSYQGRVPSYEDWQQYKTTTYPFRDAPAGSTLPVGHHFSSHSGWETRRQHETDLAANAFDSVAPGAESDTPARYTDWVLAGARSWPEEFMRSTYNIVGSDQLRQPGGMHWLYNDGTAVHVNDWTLPDTEAETLHTGVLITPVFVRHGETDGTIPAGHIGAHVHNDWSWANVEIANAEMLDSYDLGPLSSQQQDQWSLHLTSCAAEEGVPALFADNLPETERWDIRGFGPEASRVPVWAWPGVLYGQDDYSPAPGGDNYRAPDRWPRWTWANHPDSHLPAPSPNLILPPADCEGIAAGRYTPDHIHPHTVTSSHYLSLTDWVAAVGDWMSAVGDRPPETWESAVSP